jgi:hypothetical protein
VYYKQGDLAEGFNASYKVLSCQENCPGNHICRSGQCVCADDWTGTNCFIEMCPSNCSSNKSQGVCDKVSNILFVWCLNLSLVTYLTHLNLEIADHV